MAGTPASSRFVQPTQWTIGDDGSLRIDQDAEVGLALEVESAFEPDDGADVFRVEDGSGATLFRVLSQGAVFIHSREGGESLALFADAARSGDVLIVIQFGGATAFRIDKEGNPVLIGTHAAPADAALAAGECALWFDQTDGAAKLMVKAKQADGTVRTAAVNLA